MGAKQERDEVQEIIRITFEVQNGIVLNRKQSNLHGQAPDMGREEISGREAEHELDQQTIAQNFKDIQ